MSITPNILRTKDYVSTILKPEIEDLLRETLIAIVKSEYGKDTIALAESQPTRPIIEIFTQEVPEFSKYKLAKAYIRWTKSNDATALTANERNGWKSLIQHVNKVLK